MKNTIEKILQFSNERNWKPFHNPKDLAISISLEANELLENFQWKDSDEALAKKKESIVEEMADVAIYLFLLADKLGVDVEEAILSKLEKNERKYPVEQAYGSNLKYTEFESKPQNK